MKKILGFLLILAFSLGVHARGLFDRGGSSPPPRESDEWDVVKELGRCLNTVNSYLEVNGMAGEPAEKVFKSELNEIPCLGMSIGEHVWNDKFSWKNADGEEQEASMKQVDGCGASSSEFFAVRTLSPAKPSDEMRSEALAKAKAQVIQMYDSMRVNFSGKDAAQVREIVKGLNANVFRGQYCVAFHINLEKRVKGDLIPALRRAGTRICDAIRKVIPGENTCILDGPYTRPDGSDSL